ncbi:MAG: hypothetical protein IPN85_14660 [Flavobacteriales bacterium]|nr:hypothetical protein [Flavobacteriales bacterium]
MHLLSNSTGGGFSSFTGPASAAPTTSSRRSDQVSGVTSGKLKDGTYELSGEVYYKWMQNQIDYRNGADVNVNRYVEGELLYGRGRAYGLAHAAQHTGRLTGWIGYTLSRTERQIDGINNDEWYYARQDRTHDISIVGSCALNERWSLSALWTFSTGSAVTFPSGKYMVDDQVVFSYTERNGGRMPAYHRLDPSATVTKKRHTWNFSFCNAYGRQMLTPSTSKRTRMTPRRTEAIQTSLFRWSPLFPTDSNSDDHATQRTTVLHRARRPCLHSVYQGDRPDLDDKSNKVVIEAW